MSDSLQYIREYNSSFNNASVLDIEHVANILLTIDSISKENPVDLGYNKNLDKPLKNNIIKFSGVSRYIENFEGLYLIQLTSFKPLNLYIGLSKCTSHYSKDFNIYLITEGFCELDSSSYFLEKINLTGISKILRKPTNKQKQTHRSKELILKSFFNNFELDFLRKKDSYNELKESLEQTGKILSKFFESGKLKKDCFRAFGQGCHYNHSHTYREEQESSIFTQFFDLKVNCKHHWYDTHIVELDSAKFKENITNVDDIVEQFKSLASKDNEHTIKIKKESKDTTISFKASLTSKEINTFLNIIFSNNINQ